MSISIQCGCGKSYQVADNLAGKKVRCKECGEAVPVPGSPVGAPVKRPAPAAPPARPQPPTRAPQQRRPQPPLPPQPSDPLSGGALPGGAGSPLAGFAQAPLGTPSPLYPAGQMNPLLGAGWSGTFQPTVKAKPKKKK